MSENTAFIRNLCLTILAVVVGLEVGGISSYLLVSLVSLMLGPIFWEGLGIFLPIIAAFIGGFMGGLSAVVCALPVTERASLNKVYLGPCLGAGFSLACGLWFVSSGSLFTTPGAPKGISFWTVVILVIAGGCAGLIGGLIADVDRRQFGVRCFLVLMTLLAAILGLMFLFR